MSDYAPPSPPFIAARWHGEAQTPTLIVMHATVTGTKTGAAEAVARFFATESTPTSAHYVVDEAVTIQCVGDHTVAYHCGYNIDSLAIEMCFMPLLSSLANWLRPSGKTSQHRPVLGSMLRPEVRRMLRRSAHLGALLSLAYDIPVRLLTVKQLRAWDAAGRPAHLGGFTTHARMSKAFKKSTHWDPGMWPAGLFMRRVRTHVDRLKAKP